MNIINNSIKKTGLTTRLAGSVMNMNSSSSSPLSTSQSSSSISSSSANNLYSSASFPPSSVVSLSTSKYSLISLAVMSLCVWSAVMVMEPVQCRAMLKPTTIDSKQQQQQQQSTFNQIVDEEQQQQQNNDNNKNVAKRSIMKFQATNNNDANPMEACKEFISAALARNLAKSDLTSIFEQSLPNVDINNDDDQDNDEDDIDQNQNEESDQENAYYHNFGLKSQLNFTENEIKADNHLWIQLLKQCVEVMAGGKTFNLNNDNDNTDYSDDNVDNDDLRGLPREKKSWFFGQPSTQHGEPLLPTESYAKKLDFFWKELEGIRYKKQNGKIIRINGKTIPKSISGSSTNGATNGNKVSKRMILLLLNMSIAKPLLNKFQSTQKVRRLNKMRDNHLNVRSQLSRFDKVEHRPLLRNNNNKNIAQASTNAHVHIIRTDQNSEDSIDQRQINSGVNAGSSKQKIISPAYIQAMNRQEEEDEQDDDDELNDDEQQNLINPVTTIKSTLTSPVPMDQSSQSKLVESKQQEMEQPRSKKIIPKDLVLRSDPWDKEGIRFKRSSKNNELKQLSDLIKSGIKSVNSLIGEHSNSFSRNIKNTEGGRFKKSPFDDEGIRYKKSPFDDEGIRYKKSPFDNEGIRYKKSPFDDEGIRYKKSPFDDEGIRYKKSPFDNEGIRFKKTPFDDEHIRY